MASRRSSDKRRAADSSWTNGNAYEVLGVTVDSDARTLKTRYHEMARAWHPDVSTHPDAEAVFGQVARAYEILRNPQQRLVYDFILANKIPLDAPDRFQAFYARAARVDFLIRHRHRLGWAIASSFGAIGVGLRMASLRRSQPLETAAAEACVTSRTTTPEAAGARSARTAAVGGLLGSAGAGGSILAIGASQGTGLSGGTGARFTLAATLGGALAGRTLLPWAESRLGRLRSLHTRATKTLVAYSRVLCEAGGAAAAVVLMRRVHPAVRMAELHLRSLAAGSVGAVAGHGVGRFACRAAELQDEEPSV